MSWTIYGASLESLGIIQATLTYRVGYADILQLVTGSSGSHLIAGKSLGETIALEYYGSIVFSGRITKSGKSVNGSSTSYLFEVSGTVYEYDLQVPTSSDSGVAVNRINLANNISGIVKFGMSVKVGLLQISSDNIAEEVVENVTVGDLFRKALGYIGIYHTWIDYKDNQLSLNITDLTAYSSGTPLAISKAYAFNISRVYNTIPGAQVAYALEQRTTTSTGVNMSAPASKQTSSSTIYPLVDTDGSATTVYTARVLKRLSGYRENLSYNINAAFYTIQELFYNRYFSANLWSFYIDQYLNAAGYSSLAASGWASYESYTMKDVAISLKTSYGLRVQVGQARASLNGIPYSDFIHPNSTYGYGIASIEFTLEHYVGTIFQKKRTWSLILPVTDGYGGNEVLTKQVNAYTLPNTGEAARMRKNQNTAIYDGTISTDIPVRDRLNNFSSVTYDGVTYNGVKQVVCDLNSNRMDITFAGTADRAPVDTVRTLRAFSKSSASRL